MGRRFRSAVLCTCGFRACRSCAVVLISCLLGFRPICAVRSSTICHLSCTSQVCGTGLSSCARLLRSLRGFWRGLRGGFSDPSVLVERETLAYYDTPFLLDLLGYQSEEAENAAKMLHDMLRRQKAKCYYFPHIGNEITSILTAYQHTIVGKNRTWRTLEGLDRKKYTYSAVERLKQT